MLAFNKDCKASCAGENPPSTFSSGGISWLVASLIRSAAPLSFQEENVIYCSIWALYHLPLSLQQLNHLSGPRSHITAGVLLCESPGSQWILDGLTSSGAGSLCRGLRFSTGIELAASWDSGRSRARFCSCFTMMEQSLGPSDHTPFSSSENMHNVRVKLQQEQDKRKKQKIKLKKRSHADSFPPSGEAAFPSLALSPHKHVQAHNTKYKREQTPSVQGADRTELEGLCLCLSLCSPGTGGQLWGFFPQ